MTLVPVTGSLAIIAKLEQTSPGAARALLVQGLYESLCDQVDDAREWLEPVLLTEIAKMAEVAREELVRLGVSKSLASGELVGGEYAVGLDVLTEFSKEGLRGWLADKFNRDHPRDQRGRFIRMDVQGQDPNLGRNTKAQAAHAEGRAHLKRLKSSGLVRDDTPIHLHYKRMEASSASGRLGEELQPKPSTVGEAKEMMANAADDEVLTGVSVARGDLPKLNRRQQAALDIVGLMTGQDEASNRPMVNRLGGGVPSNQDANAARWNAPSGGGAGQDRQAYRRMKMTGQLLSQVSGKGTYGDLTGQLAQLVGEIGPEAEKVLGPGIRRAAYRYRGTERRPAEPLLRDVALAGKVAQGGGNASDNPREDPAFAAGRFWEGKGTRDQREMGAAGDATVGYMLGLGGGVSKVPDRELAELSEASGEIPPSQGVIIDADGHVVSQAVGFNGDHYLPFDLRNLNSLHGGQYVRTRAFGGPTTEDLYAGLMTGTRQMQVVSNSGVFTVEFDPDLRGGRRYNDKARRMVTRYQEILETIAGGEHEIYENDLPRAEVAALRRQVAAASEGEEDFKRRFKTALSQARMESGLANEDDDAENLEAAQNMADTKIRAEFPGNTRPSPQQLARMREDYTNEAMDKLGGGARKLRLNGTGYDRALRALKQEFPYFIRQASWKSLPDWLGAREMGNPHAMTRTRVADSGHVARGQTNPAIGLKGRNARRLVPTHAAQSAEARVAVNGAPDAALGSTPPTARTAAAATPERGAAPPLSRDRLLSDGHPFQRDLVRSLAVLVNMADTVPPDGPVVPEGDNPNDIVFNPSQYANHIANQINLKNDPGREGKAMLTWLTKADPAQRRRFLAGMAAQADRAVNSDYSQRDHAHPALEKTVDLLNMIDPYEVVPENTEPHMVEPNETNPRPVRFPELPDVFADEKTLTRARAGFELDSKANAAAIKELEPMTDERRAARVLAFRDAVKQMPEGPRAEERMNKLIASQKAWSLLHTTEVAERLRLYAGDAAPLAPLAKRQRPHRVIVHKVNDDFSRRLRAELGIPEPSSV